MAIRAGLDFNIWEENVVKMCKQKENEILYHSGFFYDKIITSLDKGTQPFVVCDG